MNKEEFIAVVTNNLVGGNPSSEQIAKYPPSMVAKYIEIATNSILKDISVKLGVRGDNSFLDGYSWAFENVPMQFNTARKEFYTDLPCPIIQLPNQISIRQISPMESQRDAYNCIPYGSQSTFGMLEGSNMAGTRGAYYLENERVYYMRVPGQCNVLMKLVPPFSWFDDDVNLPSAYSADIEIFNAVRQLMGMVAMTPEDTKNDMIVPPVMIK